MQSELEKIKKSSADEIMSSATLDDLERVRISLLSRNGALTTILRTLKTLPSRERTQIGSEANHLRNEIEIQLSSRRSHLEHAHQESILTKEWIDISRPGIKIRRGHLHPLTLLLREITEIFSSMGFEIVEGPEIESEYYNFDALNIPANHPARDMWDTFWLKTRINAEKHADQRGKNIRINQRVDQHTSALLLRTHTSPVQIRYMETHNPPVRIIVPGRVYRYESTDAAHDIQFWQLEGLMADKNISVANFKAIIQMFFSRLFKTEVHIRLRPSFFPFTEPSFEVDISCVVCRSKGCAICKKTGWLELAGAGMVHPNVFKAAGYNPKNIQGFAFGMGIERLAMMKYKIPDIRLFHSGDIRFLSQF